MPKSKSFLMVTSPFQRHGSQWFKKVSFFSEFVSEASSKNFNQFSIYLNMKMRLFCIIFKHYVHLYKIAGFCTFYDLRALPDLICLRILSKIVTCPSTSDYHLDAKILIRFEGR